jgi:hypothetical protein
MGLLVEGSLSRAEDLRGQDSGVLEVASSEGIDLTTKLGLAERELMVEVGTFLSREGHGKLEQVRVSEALRRWHVLKCLESVYQDAYFSQLNDRYGERWRHYKALAREQAARFFEDGAQLVAEPLRRPEFLEVRVVEGTLAAATYWVQATFMDAQLRESAPSEVQVASSPLPHGLEAEVLYPPDRAAYWNLYAGTQPETMGLQNAAPLAVGQKWMAAESGFAAGRPPGEGQATDFIVRRSGLIRRG